MMGGGNLFSMSSNSSSTTTGNTPAMMGSNPPMMGGNAAMMGGNTPMMGGNTPMMGGNTPMMSNSGMMMSQPMQPNNNNIMNNNMMMGMPRSQSMPVSMNSSNKNMMSQSNSNQQVGSYVFLMLTKLIAHTLYYLSSCIGLFVIEEIVQVLPGACINYRVPVYEYTSIFFHFETLKTMFLADHISTQCCCIHITTAVLALKRFSSQGELYSGSWHFADGIYMEQYRWTGEY